MDDQGLKNLEWPRKMIELEKIIDDGDPVRALSILEVTLFEPGSINDLEVSGLRGRAYAMMGKFSEAETAYRRSIEGYRQKEYFLGLGTDLHNLASMFFNMELFSNAEDAFSEGRQAFMNAIKQQVPPPDCDPVQKRRFSRELNFSEGHAGLALVYQGLGNLWLKQKDFDQAIDAFDACIRCHGKIDYIARGSGHDLVLISGLLGRATCLLHFGQQVTVEDCLAKAHLLAQSRSLSSRPFRAFLGRACGLWAELRLKQARYQEGVELSDKAISNLNSWTSPEDADSVLALAKAYVDRGELKIGLHDEDGVTGALYAARKTLEALSANHSLRVNSDVVRLLDRIRKLYLRVDAPEAADDTEEEIQARGGMVEDEPMPEIRHERLQLTEPPQQTQESRDEINAKLSDFLDLPEPAKIVDEQASPDESEFIEFHRRQAVSHIENGHQAEADKEFQIAAMKAYELGQIALAMSLNVDAGAAYRIAGDFDMSAKRLQQAVTLGEEFRSQSKPSDISESDWLAEQLAAVFTISAAHFEFGKALFNKGSHSDAEQSLQIANWHLGIYKPLPDREEQLLRASIQAMLGLCYAKLSRANEADEAFRIVAPALEKYYAEGQGELKELLISIFDQWSRVKGVLRQHRESVECRSRAEALRRSGTIQSSGSGAKPRSFQPERDEFQILVENLMSEGKYAEAGKHCDEEVSRYWPANLNDESQFTWQLAQAIMLRAECWLYFNNVDRALESAKLAVSAYLKLLPSNQQLYRYHYALALSKLARAYALDGQISAAKSSFEASLDIQMEYSLRNKGKYLRQTVATLIRYGETRAIEKDFQGAIYTIGIAAKISRTMVAEGHPDGKICLAEALNKEGETMFEAAERELCLKCLREASSILETIRPRDMFRRRVLEASCHFNLGSALGAYGKVEECEKYLYKSFCSYEALEQSFPAAYPLEVADTSRVLSMVRIDLGDYQGAADVLEKGVERRRWVASAREEYEMALASELISLGEIYEKLERFQEAAQAFDQGIELRRKHFDRDPNLFTPSLINALHRGGDIKFYYLNQAREGFEMLSEAAMLYRRISESGDHRDDLLWASCLDSMSQICFLILKRPEMAEGVARDSIKLREEAVSIYGREAIAPILTSQYLAFAKILQALNKSDEAEAALRMAKTFDANTH